MWKLGMRITAMIPLLGVALARPAGGMPACDVPLTAAERAAVDAGEVVVRLDRVGEATRADVTSLGYVDAPPQRIWDLILSDEEFPKVFPNVLVSETRARRGNVIQCYSLLDYPWPLPDKWTLNELVLDRPHWRIRFHRLAGTTKEVIGSWSLVPDGPRTLVVYRVHVDPGLPFVPRWAVELGSQQVAPGIINGLRRWLAPAR
jgi:hypothetical protein